MVAVFDPAKLDFKRIQERLIPGFAAGMLPPNWQRGKEPKPALPIDEFITSLKARRRLPKLRSLEDLRCSVAKDCPYKLACPYAAARESVVDAVQLAGTGTMLNDNRIDTNEALKAFSERADRVRRQLVELCSYVNTIQQSIEHVIIDELSELPLKKVGYLYGAYMAIEDLKEAFTRMYRQRSQNAGNVWQIRFVSALFPCWSCLTGTEPSPTGPFLDFVEAAWQSLSEDELPEGKWDSAIKTAKSRAKEEEKLATERLWRCRDDIKLATRKPRRR
jgi:hypothetical protein